MTTSPDPYGSSLPQDAQPPLAQSSPTPASPAAPFAEAMHVPYAPNQVPTKHRRTGLIITIAVAAVLLVAAGGVVGVLGLRGVGPFKDSGLAMCEQIRDSKAKGASANNSGSTSDDKMTAKQYHELRKQFANSRYPDIRDAGVKFVDLVWQLNGMDTSGDGALGMALVMGGQLMQAYSSLSGACGNHGVDLPSLGSN